MIRADFAWGSKGLGTGEQCGLLHLICQQKSPEVRDLSRVIARITFKDGLTTGWPISISKKDLQLCGGLYGGELHWLPIHQCIRFKLVMTVFKSLHGLRRHISQAPAY